MDLLAKTSKAKIGLLKNKLLLIFDCDGSKAAETIEGKLYVRTIPTNTENTKRPRGIENLLPDSVFTDGFYDVRIDTEGDEHRTLNKRKLCDWITTQNNTSFFAKFDVLLKFIDEFTDASAHAR